MVLSFMKTHVIFCIKINFQNEILKQAICFYLILSIYLSIYLSILFLFHSIFRSLFLPIFLSLVQTISLRCITSSLFFLSFSLSFFLLWREMSSFYQSLPHHRNGIINYLSEVMTRCNIQTHAFMPYSINITVGCSILFVVFVFNLCCVIIN